MAVSTVFTRVSLPALLSSFPFHMDSLLATLSMSGWILTFLSPLMWSGRPR